MHKQIEQRLMHKVHSSCYCALLGVVRFWSRFDCLASDSSNWVVRSLFKSSFMLRRNFKAINNSLDSILQQKRVKVQNESRGTLCKF